MPVDTRLSDPILVQRFQAVAEETRLAIVRLLSGGERCVCELQAELGAAQSRLSFHLKKLKEAGVICHRRQGRWSYYRLAPEALEEMRAVLGELGCWEPDPTVPTPSCVCDTDGAGVRSGSRSTGGENDRASCCR